MELRRLMEKCESCGITEGGKIYNEVLREYRGHDICDWCLRRWRELEERRGRTIEFEEFKTGIKTRNSSQVESKSSKRYKEIRKQAQEGKTILELTATFGVCDKTIKRALKECLTFSSKSAIDYV